MYTCACVCVGICAQVDVEYDSAGMSIAQETGGRRGLGTGCIPRKLNL